MPNFIFLHGILKIMKRTLILACSVAMVWLTINACTKTQPAAPADADILDGPIEGLTAAERAAFLRGDVAFNQEVFTAATGVGPLFVATSCGACHAGDGKGHPFTTLTRFGQTDSTGNKYLAHGAPQLQNRALPGFTPETMPAGATFSKFLPPANTGMGLLEAVTDADLLAMADPNDENGDGISGVPNWVNPKSYVLPAANAAVRNGKYIGRFGRKAGAHNLLQQTAGAYNQDMGITSIYEPHDTYTGLEQDPEVTTQTIQDVVLYLQTLKAPIPRNTTDADVARGKVLFEQINCSGCHVPTLKTGASKIAALDNKTFHPYTDMLMHDMGPGLDDGYTEGTATTAEWRTTPLWGLGLSKNSQGGRYFLLHDGRAHTIDEAIMLHGGEAQRSRDAYNALNDTEKRQVQTFLESL